MRITVIGQARLRAPYEDDIAHYSRLLSRYVDLELLPLRDSRAVLRRLPARAFVSLLDARGHAYSSLAFSAFIGELRETVGDLAFVIGGPYGAPQLERVEHRLSLGPLTFPHQLVWVVLVEQLYRAHKILAGEPYHH